MNNPRFVVALVLAGVLLAGTLVQAQAPYPDRAVVYYSSLVRAVDPCVGPGVTVVSPGGSVGCLQQNASNGGVLDLKTAAVKLYRTVDGIYIRMRAVTSTPVSLQLTLRTTNDLGLPAGASKTYEDFTILCGDLSTGPEALVCPLYMKDLEGRVYLKQRLDDCLQANGLNTALGRGNVEVLSAALVSCDTPSAQPGGKPGLLQK